MTAACNRWVAGRYCQRIDGVRLFLVGPRCPADTPAKVAGHPEPGRPAPTATLAGLQAAAAALRTQPDLKCPGCHQHPARHGDDCPLGPRARFAMAADGTMHGTKDRGPE